MTVGKMQVALARLAVDGVLFQQFSQDPLNTALNMGLNAEEAQYIAKLNVGNFGIFREVINGTRARRFAEILPNYAKYVGLGWDRLMEKFHENVVVKSSRNDKDLMEFLLYVQSTQDLVGIDLSRYDHALYSLAYLKDHPRLDDPNPSPPFTASSIPKLSPHVRVLGLKHTLDDLLARADSQEHVLISGETYLLICGTPGAEELDVFEAPEVVYHFLQRTDGEKALSAIANELGVTEAQVMEIAGELVDSDIVRWR